MPSTEKQFVVRLAKDEQDLRAAQRLRYSVFVEELGATGAMVDHEQRLEADEFDPYFDHLLLIDPKRSVEDCAHVVGVYRLLRGDVAAQAGRFYSETEYDLSGLKALGRNLLELGRSCVHRDVRGGTGLIHLWNGLAAYVEQHQIDILFGVASFHGTDLEKLALPLSFLYQNHLADPKLNLAAKRDHGRSMNLLPPEDIDRKKALAETPSLIKAYLRMGGVVGQDAYIDREFNTTDVCLIMDTAQMNARQKQYYEKRKS